MAEENLIDLARLAGIREQIDDIDTQITQLLSLRSLCVEQIAGIKCRQNITIYDGVREAAILDKVMRENPTRYQATELANIFQAILKASLNHQLLIRAEYEG